MKKAKESEVMKPLPIPVKQKDKVKAWCEYLGFDIWGEVSSVGHFIKVVEQNTKHEYTVEAHKVWMVVDNYPSEQTIIDRSKANDITDQEE